MNKHKPLLWVASGLLFSVVTLFGQEEIIQAPPPPHLPDDGGMWTIEFSTDPQADELAARDNATAAAMGLAIGGATGMKTLKSIQVTSTHDIRRDRVVYSDGSAVDYWRINGEWIVQLDSGVLIAARALNSTFTTGIWQAFDTAQVAAIAHGAPVKQTTLSGKRVFLYDWGGSLMPEVRSTSGKAPKPVGTQLYTDPTTGYPVRIANANGTYTFRDIRTNSAMVLDPPANYLQELEAVHKSLAAPAPYKWR